MERLNDYCLLEIFQYLSVKDKLNFSRVCDEWNCLIVRLCQMLKLTVRFSSSCNVPYECINLIENEEMFQLCGPVLKAIDLSFDSEGFNLFKFDSYQYIIPKTISVQNMMEILAKTCYNVITLRIWFDENIKSIPTNSLKKFVESNKELRTLVINRCDILECKTDKFYRILKKASNLKDLDISCCKLITDRFLETVSLYTTQLKVLRLPGEGDNLSSSGVKNISKLVNLETLSLKFIGSLTDDVIIEIGLYCKKIRNLELYACRNITDRGITTLLSSLPELLTLSLHDLNISKLTSDNILSNLQKLSLHSCLYLSADSFRKAIQAMPSLRILTINGCHGCFPIFSVISTIIPRNQVLHMMYECYTLKKSQIIKVYRSEEIYFKKRNYGIFYLHYCPELVDPLKIVQNYISHQMPLYRILIVKRMPETFCRKTKPKKIN